MDKPLGINLTKVLQEKATSQEELTQCHLLLLHTLLSAIENGNIKTILIIIETQTHPTTMANIIFNTAVRKQLIAILEAVLPFITKETIVEDLRIAIRYKLTLSIRALLPHVEDTAVTREALEVLRLQS